MQAFGSDQTAPHAYPKQAQYRRAKARLAECRVTRATVVQHPELLTSTAATPHSLH